MATTTYGTEYVQSSDLVSNWPGTSLNVANRLDDVSIKGNGLNNQTGTSYTLVLTDGGKTVTLNNAAAVGVTIPTNASVAFPNGVGIALVNKGAGTVTVSGAGGVTLSGASLTLAQNETAVLIKLDTNTWVMSKGGGLPKATYSATTGSPTVTTVSGKTCVQFTGSGSITIDNAGLVEVLVVGGGGGGACTYSAGGGGGVFYDTGVYLASGTATVVVGAGGAGGTGGTNYRPFPGANGITSRVGPIYGVGGGAGRYSIDTGGTPFASDGNNGGCGGGGAYGGVGGSGTSGQGSSGGTGSAAAYSYGGGGGGGANGVGSNGSSTTGGNGGSGLTNSITGSAIVYGAGGGGGTSGGTAGTGGTNAGNGSNSSAAAGNGTANRGGGGGGGGITNPVTGNGGSGGSGIVILLFG